MPAIIRSSRCGLVPQRIYLFHKTEKGPLSDEQRTFRGKSLTASIDPKQTSCPRGTPGGFHCSFSASLAAPILSSWYYVSLYPHFQEVNAWTSSYAYLCLTHERLK